MKYSYKSIGLFQAAGIIMYVCLIATTIQVISQSSISDIQLPPIAGITIFLLTFIISAIICSSIFFAYPAKLFLNSDKSTAYKILLWTLIWLVIFFVIFLGIVLAILKITT